MHESNAIYIYSPAILDRVASRALDHQGGEVKVPFSFLLAGKKSNGKGFLQM